jgi:sterol desaturase/sphingolipid hydroxylase (fatty acid hydroxylase superfamily)
MTELQMLAMAYGAFLLLIGGELAVSLIRRDGYYRLGEAVVNIGHGVVYQVWDSFTKVVVMVPFLWVASQITWSTLPYDAVWAWLLGLLAYDFLSYWAHRHHHEVHFLWAIHGTHHAAEDHNLASGLRQATFQNVFKWAWKVPLALVMPVEMFIGLIVFDYLYQFLQHTRYVPRLGPVEWVLNTPSHHRVHHGTEEKYLDKNYGGILIIWDRLFGTFQVEEEEPTYGLTKPLNTLNAVWGNLAIWGELAAATRRARGLDKLALWFRGPAHLERLAPGGPEPLQTPRAQVPVAVQAYVVVTALQVPPLLGWLLMGGDAWSTLTHVAFTTYLVLSVATAGALLERRSWALPVEVARVVAGAVGFSVALGSPLPLVAGLITLLGLGAAHRAPELRTAPTSAQLQP